jgi:membrane protein
MMHQASTANTPFSVRQLPRLFKNAFVNLVHNDPLRMAGATAFFTSFALPFILIILLQVLGLVINPRQLRKELFEDLSGIFGPQSVQQVVDTLIAFRHLADNLFITMAGVIFLLLVSTTLLMVIKGSINQLWRIRAEGDRSFFRLLGTRLQSILIIAATGILFLLSIVADAAKAQVGAKVYEADPTLAFYFMGVLTYLLSLLFVTLWFGIIFRVLPDARAPWKVAFTGALVTAILFNLGKHILRLLLNYSSLNSLYGTSASVVLVLLFVFYTSLIMYFGAAFTRVWAEYRGEHIRPMPYATHYKVMEVPEEQMDH